MMRAAIAPTLLALAVLAGCATTAAPGGDAGTLPVPATLATAAVAGSTPAGAETAPAWRDVIRDARLAGLIELALANNRDLRVAIHNIDAARAQYRISDAARLPTLDAGAAGSASRTAADLSSSGQGVTQRQVSVSLGTAAWELDLWGRVASLKDSALASYLATEQTQRSVQSSLIAEVATAWVTLAADQQRAQLAAQTLAGRNESLDLAARRKELGAASALDVATAQAAVETARGDLASATAQVEQDRNALRLLVGAEPPAALLPAGESGDAAALLAVPEGLPSSVLLRRPDVRAAELELEAAQADVAAARAAMFPTITLTASAGTASRSLAGLFGAGNGTWSFAPSIRLPIFDGGSSRAAHEEAQARRQAQLASYEKAIQGAFRDVADALAVRAGLAERLAAQQAQVAAYQTTLRLTTERRRAGAESALAVLDAQRSLWSAQQALIALQLTEQTNRLTLYKALGG